MKNESVQYGPETEEYQRSIKWKTFESLVDQKFNDLEVKHLHHIEKKLPKGWRKYWTCLCICGKEAIIVGDSIVSGYTKSCGCLMTNSRETKECPKCGETFPNTSEYFYKNVCYKTTSLDSHCRKCRCETNKPKLKKLRLDQRLRALNKIGNGKVECSCCREPELNFLGIDHVDGCGKEKRVKFHRHIVSMILKDKIDDRLRILCHNCNLGRERDPERICPHERKRQKEAEAAATAS